MLGSGNGTDKPGSQEGQTKMVRTFQATGIHILTCLLTSVISPLKVA